MFHCIAHAFRRFVSGVWDVDFLVSEQFRFVEYPRTYAGTQQAFACLVQTGASVKSCWWRDWGAGFVCATSTSRLFGAVSAS